jgi:hypothetical protein
MPLRPRLDWVAWPHRDRTSLARSSLFSVLHYPHRPAGMAVIVRLWLRKDSPFDSISALALDSVGFVQFPIQYIQ